MLDAFIGIAVTSGTTYTGSFFYRFPASSGFRGSATVSLQSSSGSTLGDTTVSLSGAQTSWAQVSFSIRANSTPGDLNNRFVITLDGGSAAGQTINFGLLSLFPPTFRNRQNGMRNDIASALAEVGPSFWRFPGGNNLEGGTVDQRWQWNATVGPLQNRAGRQGDWGYINTEYVGEIFQGSPECRLFTVALVFSNTFFGVRTWARSPLWLFGQVSGVYVHPRPGIHWTWRICTRWY